MSDLADRTRICRIFPFRYLLSALCRNKLTLRRVDAWEDTYECYIDSRECQYYNDYIDLGRFNNRLYGFSWSGNRESDAMWRIYSPNKDGVKVTTTVGKLKQVIRDGLSEIYGDAVDSYMKVGKVRYKKQRNIEKHIEYIHENIDDAVSCFSNFENIFSLMLEKRKAFSHENEIRAIVYLEPEKCEEDVATAPIENLSARQVCNAVKRECSSYEQAMSDRVAPKKRAVDILSDDKKGLELDCKCSDFFMEYTLDPRLQDWEVTMYKEIIAKILGKAPDELNITKSALYKKPGS